VHEGLPLTGDAGRPQGRFQGFCSRDSSTKMPFVLPIHARQRAFTAAFTSLTQQRREVLSQPGHLESLSREADLPHVELIPSPKKRATNEVSINIKTIYGNDKGTPFASLEESIVIENTGPSYFEQTVLTS
jgi:hypothetical protein